MSVEIGIPRYHDTKRAEHVYTVVTLAKTNYVKTSIISKHYLQPGKVCVTLKIDPKRNVADVKKNIERKAFAR